jgi:hypothetical protein
MFEVITKSEYWRWREAGLESGTQGTLKGFQDTFILFTLKDIGGSRLAEAGGGNSRVLPKLAAAGNECWNVDRMEGFGGGPVGVAKQPEYRLVRSFIGDFTPDLPANYFDVVFSISVVEHIPSEAYRDFVLDSVRILKSGGLFVHAIDVYLPDAGSQPRYRESLSSRLALYLQTAALSDGALDWVELPSVSMDLSASARWASNSVDELFKWNGFAPSLRELRENADSCSLKMIMRKK